MSQVGQKQISKMKNKNAFLMGETAVKLVIAILVITILVAFGVAIYNLTISDNSAKSAKQELNSLNIALEELSVLKPGPNDYLATKNPEWYLFTKTKGGICEDKFCLCICKEIDCIGGKSQSACVPTERFVSLKRYGKEVNLIVLPKPPIKLTLTYINERVFPFDNSENRKIDTRIPMIFYKFKDNEWKWSPDLENWMDTSTLEVTEGVWKRGTPTPSNAILISTIKGKSEANGKTDLEKFTSESLGVYRIEL